MDKSWFRKLRCGAFIHWGLYAIPGGIWKGEHTQYLGEWLQAVKRIPNAEYSPLAAQFNPVEFDADKIIADFARAGLKYIVFTAKHHDGFCLYDTKYSDYNSVKASPCHRDFVRVFADACQRHGVKMGVYYSHCLDWHEKNGGDPRPCALNFGTTSWGNDWDFPDQSEKDFEAYFQGKVLPQIEELMTNYGPISVLWNDCPFPQITAERARAILDLVHRLQPDCLVNGRVCGVKSMGDYGTLGDNELPAGVSAEDFPAEAIVTLNDTWGFKFDDQHWKTPRRIQEITLDVAQRGANLLINFGPDAQGRIPRGSQVVLDSLAEWRPYVDEALQCDGRNPFPQELSWCRCIAKDTRLWIFPMSDAGDSAVLSGIEGDIDTCSVPYERLADGSLRLQGLAELAMENRPVQITFKAMPVYDQRLRLQNGFLVLAPRHAALFHGERQVSPGSEFIGPAGERLTDTGHCFVTPAGGLRNWKNPTDVIQWECYLPAGTYQLRILTRQLYHNRPWDSQRVIRVAFNGSPRELTLRADELDEGNAYYRGAYTSLGEYRHPQDGILTLQLSPVSDPDAQAELQLDTLEIREIEPRMNTNEHE